MKTVHSARHAPAATRRLWLTGFLLATCLLALQLGTGSAHALSASYCARSVANGDNCLESYSVAHTWNYNRALTGSASNNLCAYISSGQDGSGAIYGSGCGARAANSPYSMCHAPVVNYYWAFVTHFSDSSNRTINGYAETGKNCAAASPAVAAAASKKARTAALEASYGAFTRPALSMQALPGNVRGIAVAENEAPQSVGVDITRAHPVGAGGQLTALPTRTGVCATLSIAGGESTAMACSDTAHSDFVQSYSVSPGGYTVWGLARDGIRSVTVSTSAGTVSAPVINNGFAVVVSAVPSAVVPAS